MIHAREDYNRIQDPQGRIPDDEPVFLLRAQDEFAPAVVADWARRACEGGADEKIVSLALAHAARMQEWQAAHGRKTPDLPGHL